MTIMEVPMATAQDNKAKIKWLRQYVVCGREIDRVEDELARWRSLAERSTSSVQLAPGGGQAQDMLPKTVERIVLLEEKLRGRRDELVLRREEIEAAISSVPDRKLQLLLRYLYVDGLNLREAAKKMVYSYDHTKRIHRQALEYIKMPPNDPV